MLNNDLKIMDFKRAKLKSTFELGPEYMMSLEVLRGVNSVTVTVSEQSY